MAIAYFHSESFEPREPLATDTPSFVKMVCLRMGTHAGAHSYVWCQRPLYSSLPSIPPRGFHRTLSAHWCDPNHSLSMSDHLAANLQGVASTLCHWMAKPLGCAQCPELSLSCYFQHSSPWSNLQTEFLPVGIQVDQLAPIPIIGRIFQEETDLTAPPQCELDKALNSWL